MSAAAAAPIDVEDDGKVKIMFIRAVGSALKFITTS